jgi:hypothetical protein
MNPLPVNHKLTPSSQNARPRSFGDVCEEVTRAVRAYLRADEDVRHLSLYDFRLREKHRLASRRRLQNPRYKLEAALRTRLRCALRAQGVQKTENTFVLVGCSSEQLRAHLEGQFRPGMTWATFGVSWQVDHIRPCASFDLRLVEDRRRCFHFTNLQPLFVTENRSKGARWRR